MNDDWTEVFSFFEFSKNYPNILPFLSFLSTTVSSDLLLIVGEYSLGVSRWVVTQQDVKNSFIIWIDISSFALSAPSWIHQGISLLVSWTVRDAVKIIYALSHSPLSLNVNDMNWILLSIFEVSWTQKLINISDNVFLCQTWNDIGSLTFLLQCHLNGTEHWFWIPLSVTIQTSFAKFMIMCINRETIEYWRLTTVVLSQWMDI